jgi:hypothetical protein
VEVKKRYNGFIVAAAAARPSTANGKTDSKEGCQQAILKLSLPLQHQLGTQRGAIVALTECIILDTPTELPQDVTELASKLKNAATTRYKEATDAIDAALNGEM